MEFNSLVHAPSAIFQIFFLDLILSGDNALVIALACRSLPRPLMARAIMIGTAIAIVSRILLTTVVSFLLEVPFLKLIGAVLLAVIAIKLLLALEDPSHEAGSSAAGSLGSAVAMVVAADFAMSMDNVVAIAAVAQGDVVYLILGLLLSMPLLMTGSLFVNRLFQKYPELVPAGSILLGWIAGQLAVSDPLLSTWVDTQAPALTIVVPLLCVVFVLCESRIIRRQRQRLGAPPAGSLFTRKTTLDAALGDVELVLAHDTVTRPIEPARSSAGPAVDGNMMDQRQADANGPTNRPRSHPVALWSFAIILCVSLATWPLIWGVMYWIKHG
ncbi:TerC family protein [Castellaniella sp. MT123]|uniref:TerC family protein n=1 Tax=Castellaniella sp. MT123 TaxID=3140381 RepID=UPI0031F44400